MVLELTGIGQLESGFGFIFCPFLNDIKPPSARWKCGNPAGFCRISKPGGKSGKLALAFGVFHAFHGASFPRRFSSRSFRSAATPTVRSSPPWFFLPIGLLFSFWAKI
jgi:hypothetical protein